MDFKLKELFSLSSLEKGRIQEPEANPRDLSQFPNLDEMIEYSLRVPNLIRTQTPEGIPLKNPVNIQRPFEDEALLQKLLQYRSQIPTSSRIIRASES
ncbi:MAG: hypothetical protein H7333_08495 [Bdellovibrionales bacterium]|nr:hypothetical protein [Oligoflexia bacterium]